MFFRKFCLEIATKKEVLFKAEGIFVEFQKKLGVFFSIFVVVVFCMSIKIRKTSSSYHRSFYLEKLSLKEYYGV